jgi:hypothetical protein
MLKANPWEQLSREVRNLLSTELAGKEVKNLCSDNPHGKFRVKLQDDSRDVVIVLPCCLAPRGSPLLARCRASNTPEFDSSASSLCFAYATSVGVEAMDNEHRYCSDAINSLLDAIATKGDEGVTLSMLSGEFILCFSVERLLGRRVPSLIEREANKLLRRETG